MALFDNHFCETKVFCNCSNKHCIDIGNTFILSPAYANLPNTDAVSVIQRLQKRCRCTSLTTMYLQNTGDFKNRPGQNKATFRNFFVFHPFLMFSFVRAFKSITNMKNCFKC